MNKNSLANMMFEKSSAKFDQRINPKTYTKDFPGVIFQNPDEVKQKQQKKSSKMIKITQFNSPMILEDQGMFQKTTKSINISPQKNFSIKKVSEFKAKVATNAQKLVQTEIKKKQLLKNMCYPKEKSFVNEKQLGNEIKKILITNKYNFNSQIPSSNQISELYKSKQQDDNIDPLQFCENLIFKSRHSEREVAVVTIEQKKKQKRCQSKRQKREAKRDWANEDIIKTYTNQFIDRKFSASPRKSCPRHIRQQKKYQENIEKEKRQILQMKKELNRNYAKPFVPPQYISAFSYLIYEADIEKTNLIKKISLRRELFSEDLSQAKKVFLHSHQVIASINSRTSVEVASLTKIMTCIVALDLAKQNQININYEFVTIGTFQQNIGGTSASIQKGQIYTIKQLLYGLMLPSGNDASLAIAVWGGRYFMQKDKKSKDVLIIEKNKGKKKDAYDRFIHQMNKKAVDLKMQKTKYSNSHGLSNSENRSCAFDIAILCEYAMNIPIFREIVSTKVFECEIPIEIYEVESPKTARSSNSKMIKKKNSTNLCLSNFEDKAEKEQLKDLELEENFMNNIEEQEEDSQQNSKDLTQVKNVRWQNSHALLQTKSPLYKGIKTGVTNTAGPCLASCIQINSRRFIIILLNCKNMKQRFKDTQNLRKWLFNKEGINYTQKKLQVE